MTLEHSHTVEFSTDVLIVGAGPAGASLACFLAREGVEALMVCSASSTAVTPRAHSTNQATMECLRDIGLEDDCIRQGTEAQTTPYHRWCYSLSGQEFARILFRANEPHRKGDYFDASPCKPLDLPQTYLEPLLVRYATHNGVKCRFDTKYIDHTQDTQDGTVITTLLDKITNRHYRVKSRYLAGADGANSMIVKHLDLPLESRPAGQIAVNVLVEADLTKQMAYCEGVLHNIVQPDKPPRDYASACVVRMVRPWTQWLFIFLAAPALTELKATEENWYAAVRECIGDDSVDFCIKRVSPWTINDTVARVYQKGNVFCMGDAVHRHPPMNGLGSNTCVQDAYNLAWKISYVKRGTASPKLLDTYTQERQPVGAQVVRRANDSKDLYGPVMAALGLSDPGRDSSPSRSARWRELGSDTPEGVARRKLLQDSVATLHRYQDTGLGAEMNLSYHDSVAVVVDDEESPLPPPYPRDPDLYYAEGTYPGHRLPHAWLRRPVPQGQKLISTHDLAGYGHFTLFTGIGGKVRGRWDDAAGDAATALRVTVAVHAIGWGLEYEDAFFDWARKRDVDEDGCVLVRPDRVVCWRQPRWSERGGKRLCDVLKRVLGWDV